MIPVPTRRNQRENALKLNYALQIFSGSFDEPHIQRTASQFGMEVTEFTRELVQISLQANPACGQLIESLAKNDDMIAHLDRILMIQGMCELSMKHSPAQTVINEYIELAKLYGAENSFRFVNVVMNQYKEDHP
ncbi:NusB/RsmB/TIM44 [Desulfurispirillum indicum S5]|uniref:NusB/RsmB/TIM44 n=1 Tax=Desulfurispirillum indicum (strain ATCC BAA-1389 / DSM 22839 / S5) TaxID=653733 RepID=E6W4B3_DESIS|nr:transcription antitermination factor NusB [Desulfurispirillum indicum]ADU65887.1 NusB/RsmB/TIM44 [Desulfurispirillum indicum S5]